MAGGVVKWVSLRESRNTRNGAVPGGYPPHLTPGGQVKSTYSLIRKQRQLALRGL